MSLKICVGVIPREELAGQAPAILLLIWTPTIDLQLVPFTDYIVYINFRQQMIVGVTPKEGWVGSLLAILHPAKQSLFWYDNDKDLFGALDPAEISH